MACQVKDRIVYYPLEKVVEHMDEKMLKRFKKNNGKLRKFVEKDLLTFDESEEKGREEKEGEAEPKPNLTTNTNTNANANTNAGKHSVSLKDKEMAVSRNMNSIGFVKNRANQSLAKEVSLEAGDFVCGQRV